MDEVHRGRQLQMTDEEIVFFDIITMGMEYVKHDSFKLQWITIIDRAISCCIIGH